MNFVEFFSRPEAPGFLAFAARVGSAADASVRRWSKGLAVPEEKAAPIAEIESGMLVRRWDMYPETWWQIWPELMTLPGAPSVPDTPLSRRLRELVQLQQQPPAVEPVG